MDYIQHNAMKAGIPEGYIAPKVSAIPRKSEKLVKRIQRAIDTNRTGIAVESADDPWRGSR